jgi:hypothetical protein
MARSCIRGDDEWRSEIEVPASPDAEETDDFVCFGCASIFSRSRPRRTRLIQLPAVGMIGAVLLAIFLVRTVTRDGPSLAPPRPSLASPISPF